MSNFYNSCINLFKEMDGWSNRISRTSHSLCSLDKSCFFCNMRSACLRLRQCRQKGPKCLQVNEFVCQTHQYESVLNWNWKQDEDNAHKFVENTLKLIMMCDENFTLDIAVPQNENDGAIFKVNTNQRAKNKQTLTMVDLILEGINQDKTIHEFHFTGRSCPLRPKARILDDPMGNPYKFLKVLFGSTYGP